MAVVYTDAYKFGHAWISVERLDQQEKIILVFQSSGRFVLADANMNGTNDVRLDQQEKIILVFQSSGRFVLADANMNGTNDVQFLQLFLLARLLNYGQIFTPSFL